MSRARFLILLAGCLLTLLGLLFPQCSRPEDLFSPGPMWLMDALKSHSSWQDRVTIEWFDMAVEFGVLSLLTCVCYGTTYLRGRALCLSIGIAVCCPILVALCTDPWVWIFGGWFINSDEILRTQGYLEYLLVAFVVEFCLVQQQRRDGFAEAILPLKAKTKIPTRIHLFLSQLSTGHRVLIGLLLVPTYCLIITGVQSRQEAAHMAVAPHLKAEDLTLAYQRDPGATARQYDHRYVVVTGVVNGADGGLLGDGALYMAGISCEVSGHYGPCGGGEACTVFGICEGKGENGVITISPCRALRSEQAKLKEAP
jgi:hypothetical protein